MEKWELGFNKKSFCLNYNGGQIWCEHLDSMCDKKELVMKKLINDLVAISRPSQSSHIIIILDETKVDSELLEFILNSFLNCNKQFRKIAFVGLENRFKKETKRFSFSINCPSNLFFDLEKAKQWVL